MDFLISEGRSETKLLASSPEKVRWLYGLAMKRKTEQEAGEDLRMLYMIRTACGALISDKNEKVFRSMERQLKGIQAGPQSQDQKKNIGTLTKTLAKLGARVVNSV